MQVLLPNSSRIVHFETKNRVRDWKEGAHGCAAHKWTEKERRLANAGNYPFYLLPG